MKRIADIWSIFVHVFFFVSCFHFHFHFRQSSFFYLFLSAIGKKRKNKINISIPLLAFPLYSPPLLTIPRCLPPVSATDRYLSPPYTSSQFLRPTTSVSGGYDFYFPVSFSKLHPISLFLPFILFFYLNIFSLCFSSFLIIPLSISFFSSICFLYSIFISLLLCLYKERKKFRFSPSLRFISYFALFTSLFLSPFPHTLTVFYSFSFFFSFSSFTLSEFFL